MSFREVHIFSYFSLPTDLAAVLKGWPEFQSGLEYSVDLATPDEKVSVRLVESSEEPSYVVVTGQGEGRLFSSVLGAVTHALAKNSDNLMVDRVK